MRKCRSCSSRQGRAHLLQWAQSVFGAGRPPAAERSLRSAAAHNVKLHRTGVKRFHHSVVGDLTLDFESLDLPGDPGQKLLVYSAEPGSPSRQALDLLASWASTPEVAAVDTRDEG